MSSREQAFFQDKTVFVAGAGYVGGAVVSRLLAEGGRVHALTRNPETAARLQTQGAEVIIDDLASETWHPRLPEPVDFVLNCVSGSRSSTSTSTLLDSYRHSYLEGMRSLCTWASRVGVGTLVYTSSTSVYEQGGGVVVDESSPTGNGSDGAGILREAELYLLSSAGGALRRAFVLRLAGIYGPGRHRFLDQLAGGEGLIPGEPATHLNLVHLEDIVSAILLAFAAPEASPSRILNVADNGAATRGEMARWIADRLQVPEPAFSGVPAAGRRRLTPDRIVSNEALRRVLGWTPKYPSFREGYAALLAQ